MINLETYVLPSFIAFGPTPILVHLWGSITFVWCLVAVFAEDVARRQKPSNISIVLRIFLFNKIYFDTLLLLQLLSASFTSLPHAPCDETIKTATTAAANLNDPDRDRQASRFCSTLTSDDLVSYRKSNQLRNVTANNRSGFQTALMKWMERQLQITRTSVRSSLVLYFHSKSTHRHKIAFLSLNFIDCGT